MESDAVDTIWNGELTGDEPWLEEPAEEVLDAYSGLTLWEARSLATRALEAFPAAGSGLSIQRVALVAMLTRVVCCQPEALLGLHGQLLDHDIFDEVEELMGLDRNPTILFYKADPDTRDLLVQLLQQSGEHSSPVELATALAWVDDEEVCRSFAQWRVTPPPWAPVAEATNWFDRITRAAGWTIAADGCRRGLYRPKSRALSEDGDTDRASVGGQFDQGRCAWCHSILTVFFDLNLADEQLSFLGLAGTRLVIPTCEACVCYETIYLDVDLLGSASWSTKNSPPRRVAEEEYENHVPPRRRGLGPFKSSPFEAALDFGHEMSFLGGAPAWIQNPDYPPCPRCCETMQFLGQIDTSAVAWGEGTVYGFLDSACGVGATTYQQT